MNTKIILHCFLLLSLASCKKDSTVDPGDSPLPNNTPIVSISVGNEYNIWYGELTGIAYVDWGHRTSVLRDTTVNGNKYFVLSSGELLRSTTTSVVELIGSAEVVLYRFNVVVGDSISYQGRQLKITSITTDTVFVSTQKIIEASNVSSTPDTTVLIRFATKFGMLYTRKSAPSRMSTTSLIGAKIDTIKYGNMY